MVFNFFKFFFGSKNDRILKKYSSILNLVNSLEFEVASLSDNDIKKRFLDLKKEKKGNIDNILPLVYSIVREVSKRVLNMRHFDVQILAGIALFYGKITEVATGEGKTLVATLPVCLNWVLGNSVHIVTVNEYLAVRDANWMRPIYEFLGLSVGIILSEMTTVSKKLSYKCDVVYGTCNEFGFDYLRDNIVLSIEDKVQMFLNFAIIDEVDSILIDEARTPLIISLPDKSGSDYYVLIFKLINNLYFFCESDIKNDINLDFKSKSVYLTDSGFQKIELLFKKNGIITNSESLYDVNNIEFLHIVYVSLRAKFFFKKDVDYIVRLSEILIVDENTGRILEGRRWGDGLHQAMEAKEGLKVKSENQTLASITFQNFFRLYKNLSGMTGTAVTEASEFDSIYNLEVVVIPTNKPNIRIDKPDLVFLTKKFKYKAIINDIKTCYSLGQPVLVGTASIDISEFISSILTNINVKHNVLNAKHHDKESKIIAEAGSFKSVTIATNMAGRGTDIVLGGSNTMLNFSKYREQIVFLGGLKIIGTERHESRRIDNQLRGRCARQGDPGITQFYVSLEDDLIRIFMGDKSLLFLNKLNIPENEIISHPLVSKSIENAQYKVENYNFDLRKQLLEYDDIINEQRKVFYHYRDSILINSNLHILIKDLIIDIIDVYVSDFLCFEKFNLDDLIFKVNSDFGFNLNSNGIDLNRENIKQFLVVSLFSFYECKREVGLSSFDVNIFEKSLFLQILDFKWRDHLINLDYLRKGIYLRGYAQKDPKEEYKMESFLLFKSMLYNIKYEFIITIFKIPFNNFVYTAKNKTKNNVSLNKSDDFSKYTKIGRNDMCYCDSKKKYKHCHGKNI